MVDMEGGERRGCFRMPLHYPRYNQKDYENMEEWQLDLLLSEYGLPIMATGGDLDAKRKFAIGAFLWPSQQHHPQDDQLFPYVVEVTGSDEGSGHYSSGAGGTEQLAWRRLVKAVEPLCRKLLGGHA